MVIRILDLAYDTANPRLYENVEALIPYENGHFNYNSPFVNYVSVEENESYQNSHSLTVNVAILCDSFLLSDDHIVILFPDGNEATFEISSDEWASIKVI